jgi:hypothetical protein
MGGQRKKIKLSDFYGYMPDPPQNDRTIHLSPVSKVTESFSERNLAEGLYIVKAELPNKAVFSQTFMLIR